METNLKMRREKYFPGIHKFEKLLRWLWSQFRSSCSDLEWKKPTTVNSQHVQEGYESFHMAVSDLKDTFHGLYIFRTRSQGLTALVSVSDGKIQITILILRRGPCLIRTAPHSQVPQLTWLFTQEGRGTWLYQSPLSGITKHIFINMSLQMAQWNDVQITAKC